MEDYSQIRSLFLRYMEGTINAEERAELSEAAETYSTTEWEEILFPLAETTAPDQNFDLNDWEKEIRFILSQRAVQQPKVIPIYKRNAFKWVAAAAIIIIIAVTAITYLVGVPANKQGAEQVAKTNDVEAPKETRAVITLADGTKVYLDSAENGLLANQNNVAVVKNENGEISYTAGPVNLGPNDVLPVTYNTLSNPRGSKVITLRLSDGTQVWLNSESSLKYPTAFNGNTREVEITGEAYFEVAHDKTKPFFVTKGPMQLEVLGTHFNVNAFDDEQDIKVTLLEGSVLVKPFNPKVIVQKGVVLKPGQQAVLNTNSYQLTANSSVDVEQVMAWKNGLFSFNNADIKTVMKQVARWYDVDVEYKDDIKETFFVKMSRNTNVSNVFKILQTTGGVHFKIEGKKITVMK